MKIELPLILARKAGRLIEAWVPGMDITESGTSLAALRDELALKVMQRFERVPIDQLGLFQRAPHLRLRHVDVDTFFRKSGHKQLLKGRLGVLAEKWPMDDFWLVAPTRIFDARFAVRNLEVLDEALPRRLAAFAQDGLLESLDDYVVSSDEKLDILEVDVYPRSILPAAQPSTRRPRKTSTAIPNETPTDREQRRQQARLGATTLRAAAQNLSYAADDGTLGHAFGRDALVEEWVDALLGREGGGIVFVGPTGVGKTAIVHELVHRLTKRHRAAGVRRDVWRMDGGRFIAGMKFVGQWETRARSLTQELSDTGDILFADDLASLVYAGRTRNSNSNLARYLAPHLSRGDLTIVAESTPERLARVREEEPSFAAMFRVVQIPALSELETLRVLIGVLRDRESDRSAGDPPRLHPAALEAVLGDSRRFRPHEAFPGKAVRLLGRVLGGTGKPDPAGFRRFTLEDVHTALRGETGLPDFVLGASARRDRENIRQEFAGQILGQPEALEAVTDVVLTLQAGLGDPDKPLASMLFVGPTGVGKTETAKALARFLFGDENRLLRFDMSEFSHPSSIARLVGQVGGEEGELTCALQSQPFRVVLFDEIEKAHPRIFDALLQLLGEGRLSDASGRTVHASAAVIVLTSNLGVREASSRMGFAVDRQATDQHYLSAVRTFFRPEFFNRLDRIVPFASLDRTALRGVVEHALGDLLSRRGIRRGRILVDVAPDLLDLLVEQAFDPRYGARPLRRALERNLTVPLAHHLAAQQERQTVLVELFRRENALAMNVKLLTDALPIASNDISTELPQLQAQFEKAREALDGLRDRPAFQPGAPFARELTEERHALESRIAELEEEAFSGPQYEESVDESSLRAIPEYRANYRGSGRGRGGLRPRPGFVDQPLFAV
jgi:ATP-dependent Clp protease ATP-binding subunit ClpC